MTKSKHPFLYFGIFSAAAQVVIWVLFCLYDYGIDEEHWVDDNFGLDFRTLIIKVLAVILLVPIISFICLRKRFSSDRPIKNSALQILFWCVTAVAVSLPVFILQDMDKWIIKQSDRSDGAWLDLNGIEYFVPPIIQAVCAGLLVIKLIVVAVKEKSRAK